ncbi:MAG: cupin domain-containing protein [Dehalococcoidia bacterium]
MGVEKDAKLADWNEPTGFTKAGFGKWKTPPSPYDRYMLEQEIPIHRAIGVHKVQDLPLKLWKRLGGNGTFIQLHGTDSLWGMYVVEVPGASALNTERHMYEEIYYVVEGRGSTEVWEEGSNKKLSFEWGPGSLFGIPLNTFHRVINSTSSPAILLAATTAPNIMNLIRDQHYVFNNPYNFKSRFDSEDEFFRPSEDVHADPVRGLAMRKTSLIPDIVNCDLPLDNRRAFGWRRIEPHMANANFYMKIGEYLTGQYSKAHKHDSGAILVCIKGKGYSYTWPDRLGTHPWEAGLGEEVKRQDYEPVGMISAAPMSGDWFHQHFGTHKDGLRLLIFDGPYGPGFRQGRRMGEEASDRGAINLEDGGSAINYAHEDPHVRREYEEALTKEGVKSGMEDWMYDPNTKPEDLARVGGA